MTTEQHPQYVAYTDGSYRPPNFGSYAVLILQDGKELASIAKPVFDATINRMELLAIHEALAYFTKKSSITIMSDSQYAVNCIVRWTTHWQRNNWLTMTGEPVKNRDIIEAIANLAKLHIVKIQWVRGHAGNEYNERCDKIARDITRAMLAKEILPTRPILV
jgi:ribonuclease HI